MVSGLSALTSMAQAPPGEETTPAEVTRAMPTAAPPEAARNPRRDNFCLFVIVFIIFPPKELILFSIFLSGSFFEARFGYAGAYR